MKIYRRLSPLGSKLAIILQEPLRSTIPFIPPCVTREKYFTARCAKPLQTIAAHLTAVLSLLRRIFNFQDTLPSTYKELEAILHSHFSNLWINAQKAPAIVYVAGAALIIILFRQWQLLQKVQQLPFIFSH